MITSSGETQRGSPNTHRLLHKSQPGFERGGQPPDLPQRQVFIPDRDPSRRGGTAHAAGVQTLHQSQLGGVFQHRCSGKKSTRQNGHFLSLSPRSSVCVCVTLSLSLCVRFSVSPPTLSPWFSAAEWRPPPSVTGVAEIILPDSSSCTNALCPACGSPVYRL